jgi:hypothetical protein
MLGITARLVDSVSVCATSVTIETVFLNMSNQLSEQPDKIVMANSITLGDHHANTLLQLINYLVITNYFVTSVVFIYLVDCLLFDEIRKSDANKDPNILEQKIIDIVDNTQQYLVLTGVLLLSRRNLADPKN